MIWLPLTPRRGFYPAMSLPSSLTVLSARIDKTLNEFALVANPEGEYPWQTAQREKRNRRVAGAAVGATVIGAGAYGAKKGMDALNKRYGTTGADGLKTGAADLINRGDDAMKAGMAKVKGMAGQGMDAAKSGMNRVGSYGKKILRAGQQGYKQGIAGPAGKPGLKGAASLAMRALRKVRFESVAPVLVALEKRIDERLQAFEKAA
jgi:hypothetical protein